MESFFSRYRNALVLIVVLVAQLLALAVQAKRPAADGADRPSVSLMRYAVVMIVAPPERLVRNIGRGFRSLWFGYIDLIHVRRDNANLRQEVQRLRLEQASIAQDAEQGRRLQGMLGFAEHYIYKTQPAQVIGTGGSDQSQVLLIDKGSKDGLQQDMPVITPDGIVGKVKDVFPHTSQVLLVTDPTSGVGVILETTRTRGILRGRAFGEIQVADVSPDSRIKAGQQIVTSGGDQIFPRGLAVGTVEKIIPDPERDPLVNVLVQPAASLSQLEEVLVVTGMDTSISSQETKDLAESEAEGEAEQKRASDVLSERLPGRIDPNAPADTNPEDLVDAAGNALRKLPPPRPSHPDAFSPNAEPPATQMVPGGRWAPVKYGTEDLPPASRHQPAQAPAKAPASGAAVAKPVSGAAEVKSASGTVAPKPAPSAAVAKSASGTITAKTQDGTIRTKGPATSATVAHPSGSPATPAKATASEDGTGVITDGAESEPRKKPAAKPSASPAEPEHPAAAPAADSAPAQQTPAPAAQQPASQNPAPPGGR